MAYATYGKGRALKQIDFRPAREVTPLRTDPIREPSLRGLLRGRAIGGPCNGAKVEAPGNWNGQVSRRTDTREVKLHPGRYVYSTDGTWVWEKKEPTRDRLESIPAKPRAKPKKGF